MGNGQGAEPNQAAWKTWVPLVAAGLGLLFGVVFYVALARGQSPSTDPDVTGQLLTDVSVQIANRRSEKAALERIVAKLKATATALKESARGGKVDTDFDAIEADLKRVADGTVEATPADAKATDKAPGADKTSGIDKTIWLFYANEAKLLSALSRLAPRYSAPQAAAATSDESLLAEVSFALDDALRRATPQSFGLCRGSYSADERAVPTNNRARASACSEVLSELSEDWLANTSEALVTECDERGREIESKVTETSTAIEEKQGQANALQRSLRSASALDNLVRWGFPAMAGVVAVLFLIVRSFDAGLQQTIVTSRLLLDVITILVLLTTILILGLSGKIASEVLGTLIGGITGYTLGRAALGDRTSSEKKSPGDEKASGTP